MAVVPVFSVSRSVASASTSGGGGYPAYAVVQAPIPSSAPTITTLSNGRVFTTPDPVTVGGSCPSNTLVKVFKNQIFAGAARCQNGTYQVSIDLFIGGNVVVAQAFNVNDMPGPESTPVDVQLNPTGLKGVPADQFYITSEQYNRGAEVGDAVTWPLIINGGQSPYALSISWGDGKTDLFSRTASGRFDISHVYSKSSGEKGSFTVTIRATDQAGSQSLLQLVAVVSSNPSPSVVSGVSGGYKTSTIIRIAWQSLAVATLVALSFWLGEKRKEAALKKLTVRHA